MKVFILAAGFGTRLQPLTKDTPKVMVKIGGKPVLEHLILLCKKHGLRDIIINLHHFAEKIKGYFKDGSIWDVSITYSFEKRIMGSAGALKYAEKLLGNKEAFYVLNGDVMTNVNLKEMMSFHTSKGGIGTVFVHKTDHPYDSDLVEFDSDFLVRKFFRRKGGDAFKPISKTGAHIFEPHILEFIPAGAKYSLEKQLIPDLVEKGEKLYAFYSDSYSKDIGTSKRLQEVKRDFRTGRISV
jgi:NDP-sugar pyrophosphorylase family protein